MNLIQILLPLYSNEGALFPQSVFESVKKDLTNTFGGLTAYTRSPASGLWKEEGKTVHDEIIIYEIMTDNIDTNYWNSYKLKLQQQFRQDEIIIRNSEIRLL